MNHLPEMRDTAGGNNENAMTEEDVNPELLQQIIEMNNKIHLVLRMAAMNMLERTPDGFVLRVEQEQECLAGAKTFFEAYRMIDRKRAGNWDALDRQLDAPWQREVIRMVLDPQRYIDVWRGLRMTVLSEALPLLRAYADEKEAKEASKHFTLLGLHICEKVMDTLKRSTEEEKRE
ncbi:MAG: hypothetical protein IKU34_09825 [Clostridia bacterium]|nr:hypothetical protein [Clostridia bacterium]